MTGKKHAQPAFAHDRAQSLQSTYCFDTWRCWLPFPPSVNNLFFNLSERRRAIIRAAMRRKGKQGEPPARAMSKRYREWRQEAVTRIRAAWRGRPPYPVPVVIKLELVPPDGRERDADNYNKAVLDALVAAHVLRGDSNRWVKASVPVWHDPQPTSGVIVTIRAADMQCERNGHGMV